MPGCLQAPLVAPTLLLLFAAACGGTAAPSPFPSPTAPPHAGPAALPGGPPEGAARDTTQAGPGAPSRLRPYGRVITGEAVSQEGLFKTHRIGERLLYEIPTSELGKEMLLIVRTVAGGNQSGFFGGGPSRIILWEREGNRILLRETAHTVTADPETAIARAVNAQRLGTIVAAFNIEAFAPDSAAVIDVTRLFVSNLPEFALVNGVQTDRSFLERVATFPENINVEAIQTGTQSPAPGAPPGARPTNTTARGHWSMLKLPEEPKRPRLHDRRVGIIPIAMIDYSRPEHRAETRRYVRRFRLEKTDPSAERSQPIKPIVFWIDPATPEWLVPFVKAGVDEWISAYEEAGFLDAITAREAPDPDEDPDWSMHDARHNVIYWRPSPVANATGGQVVDPRTGEILKAEVNIYHNLMNLLQNWYFVQVSPLDVRAQQLPLPDSLMGRLVQYVVAHEVGHAVGFPHNMKASAMYPADSLRSASFLRRMGGHVSTLMDYSRFNYVAQPEDSIPPELLIPTVGPYDRFAVMWQNRPIPEARTPDDERHVLDQWARMQDTIPWFRFSTTDATQDPEDITEAVGDEDAVKSSTFALLNLERMARSLLLVAEIPGEDYSLLNELYGQSVAQWSRYMSHVAAVVGGAHSQERYGTGPRFAPLGEQRQVEAVEFLIRSAFTVPDYFTDPEILRRIEQEGVINRIRAAQGSVLNTLLAEGRLNRMVEYEALAGPDGDVYTIAELMRDLRRGVWSELTSTRPTVNVYRRNLQRSYLDSVDRHINPPAPTAGPTGAPTPALAPSDARPLLRGELIELNRQVAAAIQRTNDSMTRLHLLDVRHQIDRTLNPRS